MLRVAFLFLTGVVALAETPQDVIYFLRSAAQALADAHREDERRRSDAAPFLEHFDNAMPGYAELRDEVETLIARSEVGSAIEIVTDDGDDKKRTLELDWVLEIKDQRPRRKILKCTIEKRKKEWKITAIEPIEFFKY